MDRNITLCLACSSSLPPVKSSSKGSTGIFTTPCCSRPICPTCLASNPRLARYDPCLACLSGVGVVSPRSATLKGYEGAPKNVDGAVRDEDMFVLGDDEEGLSEEEDAGSVPRTPPPAYAESTTTRTIPEHEIPEAQATTRTSHDSDHAVDHTVATPLNYYIKAGDTMQGIALRFGGRDLCRLNKLPPSTLSTTPHILHTRTSITLPPSAQRKTQLGRGPQTTEADREREARRARERAEKRLQTLTKEVDWCIAKAYVALCDDPNETMEYGTKRKEMGNTVGQNSLEGMAMDRYLEDEEWEKREVKEGRGVHSHGGGTSSKSRT